MKEIQLTDALTTAEMEKWGGHLTDLTGIYPCGHDGEHNPDCTTCGRNEGKGPCVGCQGVNFYERSVLHVVRDTCKVIKPNGKPLMIYIKDCIPRNICEMAYRVLKQVPIEGAGDNRGLAAGIMVDADDEKINRSHGSFGKLSGRGSRYHTAKKDGTMSRTTYAASVNSATIGYMDRYPRINYCRQTAFIINHPDLWQEILPYIKCVSNIFEEYAPTEWKAQKDFIDQVHPDFKILETVYTTLTVNRNFQTALHTDVGDFQSGLGTMSALQGGNYAGAELIWPQYRCALDMRTGGVVLADVHSMHGNNERDGLPGHHIRFSVVFYAREAMIRCGSKEFELERAQNFGDDIANRHAQVSSQGKLF